MRPIHPLMVTEMTSCSTASLTSSYLPASNYPFCYLSAGAHYWSSFCVYQMPRPSNWYCYSFLQVSIYISSTTTVTLLIIVEFDSENWKQRYPQVLPSEIRVARSSLQFFFLDPLSFTCSVWGYSWGHHFPCVIFPIQNFSRPNLICIGLLISESH